MIIPWLAVAALAAAPAPDMARVWTSVRPGGQGPIARSDHGDMYFRFQVAGRSVHLVVNQDPPPGLPRRPHPGAATQEACTGPWDGAGRHLVLRGAGVGPGPDDGPKPHSVAYDMTFNARTGRYQVVCRIDQYPPSTFELAPLSLPPARRAP